MEIINSNLLKKENQIILVYAKETRAKVYMCNKVDNKWITIMETEGYIGKNGLGKEKEGDLKTPIGLYNIGIAFGIKNDVKTELEYYKLNENMYWVCDESSKYYNKFVDIKSCEQDFDIKKTEHLIDEKIAYEYAIEIKYNSELIPEKGSAIFLHCIKNGPTAGCVSVDKNSMKFILENIKKNTKIYITELGLLS